MLSPGSDRIHLHFFTVFPKSRLALDPHSRFGLSLRASYARTALDTMNLAPVLSSRNVRGLQSSPEDQIMRHRESLKYIRAGALASRAASTGAAAIGALAIGALAIGAVAIGSLVIRKVFVGKVRFKSLEIGELRVRRLRVAQLEVSDSLELPPKTADLG
jgi:hypothetical protein